MKAAHAAGRSVPQRYTAESCHLIGVHPVILDSRNEPTTRTDAYTGGDDAEPVVLYLGEPLATGMVAFLWSSLRLLRRAASRLGSTEKGEGHLFVVGVVHMPFMYIMYSSKVEPPKHHSNEREREGEKRTRRVRCGT